MKMRPMTALLISAFLLAAGQGQMVQADWLSDLLSGVSAQVAQINQNVNDQVARINQDVNAQVAQAQEAAKEAIKNAKPGDVANSFTVNHGSSIVVNGNGNYRTVHSGTDAKGQPYWIQIEESVKDGVLRHAERIYNYTSKAYDDFVVVRKLSEPNAEPIFNNFTSTKPTSP